MRQTTPAATPAGHIGAFETRERAPQLRSAARKARRAALWGAFTAAGAIAAIWALVGYEAPPPPAAPTKLGWIDIQKPFALYDVNLPAFQALERAYEARRHAEGGGRRDTLAFGRLGESDYLRLDFYRVGKEASAPAPLYVTAARRAAEIGFSVERAGTAQGLDTRFGLAEIAEVALARGKTRQNCLAFQTAPAAEGDVLRLSGLSCGAGGAAPAPQALMCQINQAQLLAAGEDAALRDVFVAAERRPLGACGSPGLAGVDPAAERQKAQEAREQAREEARRQAARERAAAKSGLRLGRQAMR